MSIPIFVTGIGRSGTSALLKSLAEHPQFEASSAYGEAPFINAFVQFLVEYEEKSPAADYHLKNYKVDAEQRARLFSRMLQALHVADAEVGNRKPYWTSKISLREDTARKFDEVFPRYGVIYIVRNGIEVIHSSRNFAGFSSMDFEALCNRWRGFAQANLFLETRGNCAMMRHQDMVRDPAAAFARVFERLGVPDDEGPARFIGGNMFNSSFGGLKARKVEAQTASKEMSQRLDSAWDAWSEEERAFFLERCGAQMERFGFRVPGVTEGGDWEQPEPTSHVMLARDPKTRGRVAEARMKRKPAEYAAIEPVEDRAKAGEITIDPQVVAARAVGRRTSLKKVIAERIGMPIASYGTHPAPAAGLLYVETPKVACTTIKYLVQSAELEARGEAPRPFDRPLIHRRAESPLPLLRDMSDKALLETLQKDDGLFRFAVVRNPFERALSCYLSKVVPPMPQRVQLIARQDGTDTRKTQDDGREFSLRQFLEIVAGESVREMDPHWRPQVDQILVGLIDYDFVADYAHLPAALGYVKHRCFPNSKVTLPAATNRTSAGKALAERYDEESVALVRRIYAEDFTAFGYSTDLPGGSTDLPGG